MLNPLLGRQAPAVTPIRLGGATGRVGEFGLTRVNADGTKKQHKGIDLLCVVGWPVFAAHDGVVERVGFENPSNTKQGYGLRVWLSSDDGRTKTIYAHLLDTRPEVETVGARVAAGELIGLAGRSGNVEESTPTHLHFEIHKDGTPVDPALVLRG